MRISTRTGADPVREPQKGRRCWSEITLPTPQSHHSLSPYEPEGQADETDVNAGSHALLVS